MRLVTLDLDRYGPFTGRRLDFRPDARLHLVFGPNEAGKSCSLAAVTDLLFGIERKTMFDFLHAGKEMRLAATIRDRHGRELRFARRKLKPVLSGADEAPLADDALAPFLGGLPREVFRRAFGLDAEALRRSGEELRDSGGELGLALFSAMSGLRGFGEVRTAMVAEADRIFAERRSQNRSFYQASDRHEAARKALREHETRAGELKALRDGLAGHELRGKEISERRAAIAAERARLDRLRRAAPILRAIAAEETRRVALGALPAAPAGTGAALIGALRAAGAATVARDEAVGEEARRREAHAAITVDQAVLDEAATIEALGEVLGAYTKGRTDLPALEREEDAATRGLGGLAVRLGLGDAATLLARQPGDAALARLAELAKAGRRLDQARESKAGDMAGERDRLAERRRERERRGAMRDPAPWRERLAAFAELRRLAETTETLALAVAAETAELARAAARLSPPVADLAALALLPLPGRDAVAGFAKRLAGLDEEVRAGRRRLDDARQEAAGLALRLETLAAGAPVPTAARIAAARERRDGHWSALRRTLFGEPDAVLGAALAAAAAGFETARSEADGLADAALADATRVASHAELGRDLDRQQALAAERAEQLAAIEQQAEAARAQWVRNWAPAGIVPLAPGEMAGWLQSVATLLERGERLDERGIRAAAAARQIAGARPALGALLAELGLGPLPGLPLTADLTRAESAIARLAEGWDAARAFDSVTVDIEARLDRAEAEARAADAAFAGWREAFSLALPRIGLGEAATIAEAEASLEVWREVPATAARRDDLRRRIDGIRRDAARFAGNLDRLAAATTPDLAGEPEPSLRLARQRLNAAREARNQREAAAQRLAEAEAARLAAEDRAAAAGRAVTVLVAGLGLPEDADLAAVAAGLAGRDAVAETLARRRDELANAADGSDEDELRAALAAIDLAATEADLARLDAEASRLETEGQQVYAAGRDAAATLEGLGGSVDAEVASQQRSGAEAEMLEAARDWAVLSIGALMIETAITRQRQSRQEPLMTRAGALFATLTGGAFAGLGQTHGEDDLPHLVGRRAGGAELAVAAMSEGTRDQLYLALRLAYVEDYATRAEPPPFLADDLFASFDDGRTAHGLRALAAIGGTVQPILFTHHRFMVELARRELGDAVDVLELG